MGMALAEEFTLKSHLLQTACAEKTGTFFSIKTSLNFSSFSFACKGMQRTGDRLQRYAKTQNGKQTKTDTAAEVLRIFLPLLCFNSFQY